ncbi:response regulator [Aestuariivita boseongensis]|uniref:response regulator n=1 Tax=Aestuariivita boseongensis TaxID=1470562 RepID=UPI0006805014|nr:response regulator [Aestuariivita boseongensis]
MKILAVDDDPSILEVLEAALSTLENYDVFTAMSAAEGLEILMDHPEMFQAALIDIQMPEMNGIELCREIRKLPDYTDTPLIVVTAMSQRSYISDAFRAGATDYVTKPFDLIDLRSRVASAVRQASRNVSKRASGTRDLSEALQLRNVTRFLGQDEYENYVMQISQSLTSKSSVVAIKVNNVKHLHDALEPEEFQAAMETVGKSISELTRQDGHMISYRGNGIFLCIRIGRYDVLPDSFELVLNREIYANKPDALAKVALNASVGDTAVLRSNSKVEALDALGAAIASAEERAESASLGPDMSRRILSNQSRSTEEKRVERRVYSRLLKDVMREDGPLEPNFGRQSR